jgi:hypothetical protein
MEALDANTKVIRTSTSGKRLLHDVFDDSTQKPYTVEQYCARVMRLFKSMHAPKEDFEHLDWVKSTNDIIEFLDNAYPNKLPTQATSISPLLVIARKLWPSDQRTYKALFQSIHCGEEGHGRSSASSVYVRA